MTRPKFVLTMTTAILAVVLLAIIFVPDGVSPSRVNEYVRFSAVGVLFILVFAFLIGRKKRQ